MLLAKINVRDRNKNIPDKPPNWEYRFETAKQGGKRKQTSQGGFRTKREALEAGIKALNEYNNTGKSFEPSDISVGDYFDYWLKNYVEANLADSTLAAYTNIIDNHIKPRIGFYKLKAIDTLTLQELINYIHLNRAFKKSFLKNILKVLKGSFSYAKKKAKLIQYDPAEDVELPVFEPEKSRTSILTKDEVEKLFIRFKNSPYQYYALVVGYYTGLRVSEVYGLTWDCIDFNAKTLTVNKIVKKITADGGHGISPKSIRRKASAKWYLGACKTVSSNRVIKMGDALISALKEYKALQEENKAEYGELYQRHYLKEELTKSKRKVYRIISMDGTSGIEVPLPEAQLVMVKENGEYRGTDAMKYPSKVAKYELGVDFRFHSLRHTHATKLVEANAPIKSIQERLGHSNVETTINTYVTNTEHMQDETARLYDETAAITLNIKPRNERLHGIWRDIINRCNRVGFYRDNNIRVSDEWESSFEAFESWAMANGYQDSLSLLRINKRGDYEPKNCFWGTENKSVKGDHIFHFEGHSKSYSIRKVGKGYAYRITTYNHNGERKEICKAGYESEDSACLAAEEKIFEILSEQGTFTSTR